MRVVSYNVTVVVSLLSMKVPIVSVTAAGWVVRRQEHALLIWYGGYVATSVKRELVDGFDRCPTLRGKNSVPKTVGYIVSVVLDEVTLIVLAGI